MTEWKWEWLSVCLINVHEANVVIEEEDCCSKTNMEAENGKKMGKVAASAIKLANNAPANGAVNRGRLDSISLCMCELP